MSNDFTIDVNEVWHLDSRAGPIVTGPVRSGACGAGDALEFCDAHGTTTATVIGIEFHAPRGEVGLLLGEVEGELRKGQVGRGRAR